MDDLFYWYLIFEVLCDINPLSHTCLANVSLSAGCFLLLLVRSFAVQEPLTQFNVIRQSLGPFPAFVESLFSESGPVSMSWRTPMFACSSSRSKLRPLLHFELGCGGGDPSACQSMGVEVRSHRPPYRGRVSLVAAAMRRPLDQLAHKLGLQMRTMASRFFIWVSGVMLNSVNQTCVISAFTH